MSEPGVGSADETTRGGTRNARPGREATTGVNVRGARGQARRRRGAEDVMVPEPTFSSYYGKPVLKPRYGLHALRHFFASWAIEREFPPKKVQALLGHASIQMTFDTYGHLFPSEEDDHARFAAGELALTR